MGINHSLPVRIYSQEDLSMIPSNFNFSMMTESSVQLDAEVSINARSPPSANFLPDWKNMNNSKETANSGHSTVDGKYSLSSSKMTYVSDSQPECKTPSSKIFDVKCNLQNSSLSELFDHNCSQLSMNKNASPIQTEQFDTRNDLRMPPTNEAQPQSTNTNQSFVFESKNNFEKQESSHNLSPLSTVCYVSTDPLSASDDPRISYNNHLSDKCVNEQKVSKNLVTKRHSPYAKTHHYQGLSDIDSIKKESMHLKEEALKKFLKKDTSEQGCNFSRSCKDLNEYWTNKQPVLSNDLIITNSSPYPWRSRAPSEDYKSTLDSSHSSFSEESKSEILDRSVDNFYLASPSIIENHKLKPEYEELLQNDSIGYFIDTHCHLDFLFSKLKYNKGIKEFRQECEGSEKFPSSYEGCITIFCNPLTFRKWKWYDRILSHFDVWGAFGCHPHFVDNFGKSEEEYLVSALKHEKVIALGEIGLDYSGRNDNSKELQKTVFRRQLEIALEFKKPLVIHCRDAHEDCIEIMKEIVPREYYIHRHCFTGHWEEASEWLETFPNVFLGITCLVTYNSKRAFPIKKVVQKMPLNRLLLETDAPYFRPTQIIGEGNKYSHPGMAIYVADQIAKLRNIPVKEVLYHARTNTQVMYSI